MAMADGDMGKRALKRRKRERGAKKDRIKSKEKPKEQREAPDISLLAQDWQQIGSCGPSSHHEGLLQVMCNMWERRRRAEDCAFRRIKIAEAKSRRAR